MRMTNEEVIEYFKKNAIRIKGIMAEEDEALKDRFSQTLEATEMAIKALEQEPKTGHWINDKCSICGKGIEDLIDSREWYKNETPNYCPFCGKRVVESEVK